MDFFVVPTATFKLLYGWFAIEHARRRVLHFDVTDAPTAAWSFNNFEKRSVWTPPDHRSRCDRFEAGPIDPSVVWNNANEDGVSKPTAEQSRSKLAK
jgi:hypothetical protein